MGAEAGVQIALAFCITWIPGTIIIGALAGAAFGFLGGKISNLLNKSEKKPLIFYSDSLYYQYIPRKYREFSIPILKWENPPIKAKNYAIELIVNEDGKNPNWLAIKIPAKLREFNEYSKEGELIVNYKGILENDFLLLFYIICF